MRPMADGFILALLVGCLVSGIAVAGEPACDGPYKGRTLTPEELATVLRNHRVHTWPTPSLPQWGIPPTREGLPRGMTPCSCCASLRRDGVGTPRSSRSLGRGLQAG
jgi:hypothetical protein